MRHDLLPHTFDGKVARVVEECGETLQAIGKLQRFGRVATDPSTKFTYDNVHDLNRELQDLQDAIRRLRRVVK